MAAVAVGAMVLPVMPAGSSETTVADRVLPLAHETPAADLGLSEVADVAYAAGSAELLVSGRAETGAGSAVVGISALGDVEGRGRLHRVATGRPLAYDSGSGRLVALAGGRLVDAATGARLLDVAPLRSGQTGGLQYTPDGNLLLVDSGNREVVRVPEGGGVDQATRSRLGSSSGLSALAYNPQDGLLYAAEPGTGVVHAFDAAGERAGTYEVAGARDITGLEFAPSADTTDSEAQTSLYVADSTGAPGGRLLEVSMTAETVVAEAATTVTATLVRTVSTAAYVPPSPDPAGVTYLPDSGELLISDCEVEEMSIYAGANLWRTSRTGALAATGDTTRFTVEPTGVSYVPANRHVLVSDDDANRVFDLDPGPDGRAGTSDDTATSFAVGPAGNGDAEGVALDTSTGDVYTIDGTDKEVYLFRDGTAVSHFDVAVYGAQDPEGIDYDADRDTLVVVDQPSRKIYEVTTDGQLVTTIDISAADVRSAAGVTVAPASDGSGARNYYVVARGTDNDNNPSENDGLMLEMSVTPPPVGNQAPVVDAGPNQSSAESATAQLEGSVSDDGLPSPPGAVTTRWSTFSGPGTVTFGDPNAMSTTASFSAPGSYVLQLAASDGELQGSDTLTVEVVAEGTPQTLAIPVAAGSDDAEEKPSGSVGLTSADLELVTDGATVQTVGLRFTNVAVPPGATILGAHVQFTVDEVSTDEATLTVQGQAADDPPTFTSTTKNVSARPRTTAGVPWTPAPWGTVGANGPDQRTPDLWSIVQEVVDRPGWTSGNALVLVVTGSGKRTAEAFDGAQDPVLHIEYQVGGPAVNRAPVADAGPDQTVELPEVATLSGSVSDDDGLPNGTVSATWSKSSGPGVVTFGDDTDPSTTAAFSAAGSYLLRLDATDGELQGSDTVAVEVLAAGTPRTLAVPVGQGSDDAEERISSGAVSLTGADLELGADQGRPQAVGLRFAGLDIPQGATIQSAYVQLRVDEATTADTSLTIQGHDTDSAPTFQAATRNITSRTLTEASIAWLPPAWTARGLTGVEQQTPDIAGVLQEVVDRPGWASGNALALVIRGSGVRTADPFEGGYAPVLHVVFQRGTA